MWAAGRGPGSAARLLASGLEWEYAMDEYSQLKKLVDDMADDIYKAAGGNKAAGTRVRKVMQDIKNLAQDIRKKMLGIRAPEQTPPAQP